MLLSRTDSISLWSDLPSRTMTLPLTFSTLPSRFCLGSASNLPPPLLCNLPCNLPPAAFMAVSQTRVMGTRSCPSGRMQLTDSELRFSLPADACCCAPETIQSLLPWDDGVCLLRRPQCGGVLGLRSPTQHLKKTVFGSESHEKCWFMKHENFLNCKSPRLSMLIVFNWFTLKSATTRCVEWLQVRYRNAPRKNMYLRIYLEISRKRPSQVKNNSLHRFLTAVILLWWHLWSVQLTRCDLLTAGETQNFSCV